MTISGLDEAALGPRLGPFVACLTRFRLPVGTNVETIDLYAVLSRGIKAENDKTDRLWITDSKAVYRSGGSASPLETAALAALGAGTGEIPGNFGSLLRCVADDDDFRRLTDIPWFRDTGVWPLPWAASIDEVRDAEKKLKQVIRETGVAGPEIALRIVPAKYVNISLKETVNKAATVWDIIGPLILRAVREEGRLNVDRLGGRRYYRELLSGLLGKSPVTVVEEKPHFSRYRWQNHLVDFSVGADSLHLETALASIVAKYVRETAMRLFNAYWSQRVPGIRPTAGYPVDADRFLADLRSTGTLPENIDLLVRRA